LNIQYGVHTDRGRVREANEDSYAANAKSRLFLVADGMGGHVAGEVASSMAVSTIEECVALLLRERGRAAGEILKMALEEANARIHETQLARPELAGMGSTVTALLFGDRDYHLAHVGDSRAYLLRGGELHQLTRDHSLVWHLYENGILRKEELAGHPRKNVITRRSIGPHPQVEIDMDQGPVRDGDLYLLCSDGLSDVVSEERMKAILGSSQMTPQRMSEALVEAANDAGSPDNVTVVVVKVGAGASPDDVTDRITLR